MTDRYDEFKEWVDVKYAHTEGVPVVKLLIKQFEEEQAEKQKEEEAKQILSQALYCLDYDSLRESVKVEISTIYNKLKDKDLIK